MPAADREAFLAEPHIGVLTISRGDGQPPLASPIWYEYEPGGDVVINVGRGSVKARLAEAAGVASLDRADRGAALPLRHGRRAAHHRPPPTTPPAGASPPATSRPRWSTTTSRPVTPRTW